MDAFTISTGVAGFLSLALEISKILKSYVDGVKSAPEEAHTLLTNVTALCDVLEQLVRFLRKDYKGNFANTSAMAAAIEACKDQITQLYKKIENIEVSSDKSKITQVMERLKWPLRKEDYDNTISTVQRFTQTFQFSLTISNCELLAKTSEEVLAELKAREGQMKQTLESFGSMQFPGMESLLTESKKQMDFLGDVIKTLELGQETQQKILVVTQDTNRIVNDQEMESLLQWISPLEPHTRHQDIRSKRLKNIGKWFLESEIFRNWQDKSHEVNIFGCYGIPGAGKTFISSLVIDHLSSFAGDTSCVAYVYCDYQDRDEQTAVNMIGGLLKQAITGSSQKVSPDAIEPLLKKKKSRQAIEIQDAVSAFSGLIRCFDKTYICIDALDECNETDRRQLIQYLAELSSVSNQKDTLPVRLFFTGRPSMEKYVQSHTSIKPKIPLMVKLQASTEDIAAYIAHRISEDNMVGMDDDFKEHIIKEIVSASQNMFLLPALQIEAVLDEPTIRKRRKALQNMPRELYDVFGLTMDRIRAQKQSTSTLAMNVLQWIFLAARPLSLEELRHALSVEPGDTKLHGDNFVEAQFILDSCLGLVIVDESTSTVRLVHKALQDYFQEMYDEGSLFSEGHMEIASICMTYMAFDHFNQEVCTLKGEILDRYPLLGYAAVRWDYHLRSSKTRNTAVEDMAFTLVMEKYTSQLASNIFLTSRLEDRDYFFEMPESQLRYYIKPLRNTESFTATFPIHLTATTGSPELFLRVIDSVKVDINAKDAWGNHPLALAASMGHRSVVEIILDPRYNADVNTKARNGSTTLLLAAAEGHTDIVKMLLEKGGVDVNKTNHHGDTPSLSAAKRGHTEIVRMLLEKDDVDVNTSNKYGYTPLSSAVERGHTEIVKILLEKDRVDVNTSNEYGDTPLLSAVKAGHTEIVRILLKKDDVDVNTSNKYGYTPLSSAAEGGHTVIVKMLLEKDGVDVNMTDNAGDTPLSSAAEGGHTEIVKMLLEKDGVDANTTNTDGDTPLSLAANRGHTVMVKMLLEKDHVDVNNTNNFGNSPLLCAAGRGHTEIVKMLLEKDGVDVNMIDNAGDTPLSSAAEGGHTEIVKTFLEKDGVDVNTTNTDGDTPLSLAANRGHTVMVKMLLEKDHFDVNNTNNFGNSPLLCAAGRGHTEIVRILLKKDDVDVNTSNKYGYTPLSSAARGGHTEIVKMLLEKDGVDVNTSNKYGYTPLSSAARGGHTEIVKMLLEKDGVDVNTSNEDGDTPLSFAAKGGHTEIVKMLLEKDDVDVNTSNRSRDTPLSFAAEGGHTEIVKMLLEKGGVDVNNTNDFGYTPLLCAAGRGHTEIVKMLLEKGGVDVNNRYYFGYTPLSSAAKGGHTEIVKMLLEKGGVDVNNTNDFGYTPLSLATKEGHTEIVKIVTEHGATVDRKGKRVMTPLSHAAQSHRVEALNIPLRSSADSNLKDEIPGRTPLIWSFYNPHPLYEDKDYHDCDILNSLLSYPDTNVNAKANDGSTALSRAINVNSMKPKNS